MKQFFSQLIFAVILLLISVETKAQLTTQLTNLPTLYITTTDEKPIVSKDDYLPGTLTIAAPTGTIGAYSGPIEIRGRGNSTWEMDKKPYRIKLPEKYRMLDMPASAKNWVLLANYADKTLMRNALAFEVSKMVGLPYSLPYRFVDVYVNNEYIGNYTLTDNVEVGKGRVDIDEQKKTDLTEPNVTGGYLVEADGFADQEISKFYTNKGMKFTIHSPKDDEIKSPQYDYIKAFFQSAENKLFADNYQDPSTGYLANMDKESLVNWYLACEITGNSDAFWSTYMFKKRNDPKIYFGPLWDYDIAFNNDDRLGDATYKRMSDNGHFPAYRVWIDRLLIDPNFRNALAIRWKQLKAAGLFNNINSLITSMKATLEESQVKNYEKWPTLNTKVYLENKYSGTYDEHVEFLRTYMHNRLTWLELEITGELGNDTYYKIINKRSGKAIVPGTDPAVLVQQTFQATNNSHHWAMKTTEIDGNKYFTLTNRATGTNIVSPDNTNQSQLSLAPASSSSRQQWRLVTYWDHIHFSLVNRENNQAIDNYFGLNQEGNKVSQYSFDENRGENQLWRIIATDAITSPLPIYTSGFKAQALQNTIELSWQVHEQKNGSHFEIQRFTDQKLSVFENLGTVMLTDQGIGQYKFMDKSPLPLINYYRLKQIDLDGTFSYSKIVSAKSQAISQLSLWPVPAVKTAEISFFSSQKGTGSVEIYNPAGVKLKTIPLNILNGQNNSSINVSNFSQGLYLMKVAYNDESTTLKMLKVNE